MTFPNWHIHTSYFVIAIVVALVSYVGVHSWIEEHDGKLLAQQQEKVSEATIVGLQSEIKSNNDQIKTLQQGMQDVTNAAQRQVSVIVKQAEAVKTPQQAIQNLDAVSTRPLDAKTTDTPDRASVLALPLYQELSQCRVNAINLAACTKNLDSETKIAATTNENYQKQVAITAEKQKELDAVKKPKKFWSRVGGTLKQIGIGIGIGLTVARVL